MHCYRFNCFVSRFRFDFVSLGLLFLQILAEPSPKALVYYYEKQADLLWAPGFLFLNEKRTSVSLEKCLSDSRNRNVHSDEKNAAKWISDTERAKSKLERNGTTFTAFEWVTAKPLRGSPIQTHAKYHQHEGNEQNTQVLNFIFGSSAMTEPFQFIETVIKAILTDKNTINCGLDSMIFAFLKLILRCQPTALIREPAHNHFLVARPEREAVCVRIEVSDIDLNKQSLSVRLNAWNCHWLISIDCDWSPSGERRAAGERVWPICWSTTTSLASFARLADAFFTFQSTADGENKIELSGSMFTFASKLTERFNQFDCDTDFVFHVSLTLFVACLIGFLANGSELIFCIFCLLFFSWIFSMNVCKYCFRNDSAR